MISLLLCAAYSAPIQITHDLRDSYLYMHPIVITYRIENTSDKVQTIPDLSYQTSRASFTIKSKNKTETRSNSPKKEQPTWVIPPRGARLLRLEIPRGNSLSTGDYSLTLKLDYNIDQFTETHQIRVHEPQSNHIDLIRSINGDLAALWTETQSNGTYYNTGTLDIYVQPETENPKLIVHSNSEPYDFNVQGQSIYIRGKQNYQAVIPYKDAITLSRVSFYNDQYHIPIWRPQSKKLMLMHMNQQGIPSFRHVRSNTPKIIHTDVSHTAEGTPLYLFHHNEGVEIIKVEPPQNPKWPINSKYIYKQKSIEEVLFAQFELHLLEGITATIITKEDTSMYRISTSLSGKILHKEKIAFLPNGRIVDSYQSNILIQEKDQYIFVHNETKEYFSAVHPCRINKNGLICFQNGSWKIARKTTAK